MAAFFTSGRAVDLILLFMLIEAAFLIARGKPVVTIVLTLAPGAAMMLALRAAITGSSWVWVAIWLTVSLPLHMADLRHRRLL